MFSTTKIYTFSLAKIVIFLRNAKHLSIFLSYQPHLEFVEISHRFPCDKTSFSSQENIHLPTELKWTDKKTRVDHEVYPYL